MTSERDSAKASGDQLLLGILSLLAVEREERIAGKTLPIKTELVLSRAGVSTGAIATALGKSYDAVRMTISRADSSGRRMAATRDISSGPGDGAPETS